MTEKSANGYFKISILSPSLIEIRHGISDTSEATSIQDSLFVSAQLGRHVTFILAQCWPIGVVFIWARLRAIVTAEVQSPDR